MPSENLPVVECRTPFGHPFALLDEAALGECYRAIGRGGDARQRLESALASHQERFGPTGGNARVALVMAELGLTLVQEKDYTRAEELLRRALEWYDLPEIRDLGRRLRPPQRALSGLGLALAGQGRFTEAEPLVVRAYEELKANENRIVGNRTAIVSEALDAVIAMYEAWGRAERVAEWSKKRDDGLP